MRAWRIGKGDSPNKIIAAALKSNAFSRSTTQVEWKKRKLLRSYALIRDHIDTLGIILGDECTKDDKKLRKTPGPNGLSKSFHVSHQANTSNMDIRMMY